MSSKSIETIYKGTKNKETDFITPLLVILIVGSLFGYLYTSAQTKLLRLTWDSQKCSPRYVFFSGFLNPMYKDPWKSSETNFNRCVATAMYKDPHLTKEIKRNENYIKKNSYEMKDNLQKGTTTVEDIREKWGELKDKLDMDVQMLKSNSGGIFEKQGSMHNDFSERVMQIFSVLKSVMIYIKGILLYRVSQHKTMLDVNKKHEYYMARYEAIYQKYKQSFEFLDKEEWAKSMNTAREAIDEFNALNLEISEFMKDNEYRMTDINKSCYHLKYDLEDASCETLFPKLIDTVAYQPFLKNIT